MPSRASTITAVTGVIAAGVLVASGAAGYALGQVTQDDAVAPDGGTTVRSAAAEDGAARSGPQQGQQAPQYQAPQQQGDSGLTMPQQQGGQWGRSTTRGS